jgi:hypothetical protein
MDIITLLAWFGFLVSHIDIFGFMKDPIGRSSSSPSFVCFVGGSAVIIEHLA